MIGFINVNKPVGMTSAQVVGMIKRKLGLDKSIKIGHMGTLDMQASGVLPIAIGRATRLFDFMLTKRKFYCAEFSFGFMTDTLDSVGEVIKRDDKIILASQINDVLGEFLGDIMQVPPLFSAKNVGGRRASDITRAGEVVTLSACPIHIYKFDLIGTERQNVFTFDIECSAGTYIRSLCRDLATRLGTVGTMTALVRTKAGVFELDEAVSLDDVSLDKLLPPEVVLGNVPKLNFDTDNEMKTLLNGKRLNIDEPAGIYAFYSSGILRGLCEIDSQKLAKMKIWL